MRHIDPAKYRVTADTADGGGIDLDAEVALAPDGHRVTEAETEEFTVRRAGRPSLSGRAEPSPVLGVRLPAELRARAEALASAEGVRLSDLVRDALAAYVAPGAVRRRGKSRR